jgi:hypothetical protein
MKTNGNVLVGITAVSCVLFLALFPIFRAAYAQRKAGPQRTASPTIDPATCAVYILAGHMANAETTKQMAIDVAYYEGDLQMEHFAAVDRARQELVRSAFEMCAFLQAAVQSVTSDRVER